MKSIGQTGLSVKKLKQSPVGSTAWSPCMHRGKRYPQDTDTDRSPILRGFFGRFQNVIGLRSRWLPHKPRNPACSGTANRIWMTAPRLIT